MTTARARAALLALGALVALALVVIGASSTAPRWSAPPPPTQEVHETVATRSPMIVEGDGTPSASPQERGNRTPRMIGRILIIALIAIAAAAAIALAGWVLWRSRLHLPGRGEDVPDVDEEAALTAQQGRDLLTAARQRLADPGAGGDPIIEAYRALEAEIGRAGIPRRRTDTTIEHVTRVLGALDLEEAALREFAELYGRALFSGIGSTEAERDRASDLLDHLAAQLETEDAR